MMLPRLLAATRKSFRLHAMVIVLDARSHSRIERSLECLQLDHSLYFAPFEYVHGLAAFSLQQTQSYRSMRARRAALPKANNV
jgi:hypothetical protein